MTAEQMTKRCKKCRWSFLNSNYAICMYWEMAGKLRGCPGGDKCTKFESRRRSNRKALSI